MTLENQQLHLHIAELEARLAEEQARAERAEGEVTHLKAELAGLEDHFNRITAERAKYRLALQAIAECDFSEKLIFAGFAWLKARETLGMATAGEGVAQ